jgi:hypothetical protein
MPPKVGSMVSRPLYDASLLVIVSPPDGFASKFDQAAPIRRLGRLSREQVRFELRQRVTALQCFRRGNIHDGQLPDALLRAYLMVLEDDAKNSAQLLDAGLLPLLQSYILQKLTEGSEGNNGWPHANENNTLAVILFFLLSSEGKLYVFHGRAFFIYHTHSKHPYEASRLRRPP